VKSISLSRILGRQGLIRNYDLSRIKNDMREDDEMTGNCVCTNMERYYEMDERDKNLIYNKKRYRAIKF
jgi:hypothetical protein